MTFKKSHFFPVFLIFCSVSLIFCILKALADLYQFWLYSFLEFFKFDRIIFCNSQILYFFIAYKKFILFDAIKFIFDDFINISLYQRRASDFFSYFTYIRVKRAFYQKYRAILTRDKLKERDLFDLFLIK